MPQKCSRLRRAKRSISLLYAVIYPKFFRACGGLNKQFRPLTSLGIAKYYILQRAKQSFPIYRMIVKYLFFHTCSGSWLCNHGAATPSWWACFSVVDRSCTWKRVLKGKSSQYRVIDKKSPAALSAGVLISAINDMFSGHNFVTSRQPSPQENHHQISFPE